MKITTIVPCYNEESALKFFQNEMNQVMDKMRAGG